MDKSTNFQDPVRSSQEPAAYQEENQDEKTASMEAPEFQMKLNPVQKQEEEEEMLQPKLNPVQKQEEEEEMLQPKMNPVQKQEEEEEMLQPKNNPVQKQEEEEEMLQPKMSPIQKKGEEEEEEMMMKQNPVQKEGMPEEEEIMMKRSNKKPYQLKAKQVEQASTGMASELPPQLQDSMGHTLKNDFSNTQIYTNSEKAEKMGALAYAQGNEIHFAPGKYNPESKEGKELIGHELTHIVQQKKGVVQKTKKDRGMPVNNEYSLEKEADDLGKKAANSSFEDTPRKTDTPFELIQDENPDENNQ